MDATRNAVPTRRQINQHPHPDFSDAVTVTRFWRSVAILGPDECWLWQGDQDGHGYGVFYFRRRMRPAHELALSFTIGEARADGLDTCHACDVPLCCNPSHLRFGTRQSNVDDMYARGRAAKPGQRLTDAEVREIRLRRAMGARQVDLAAEYGVSIAWISGIISGRARIAAGGPTSKPGRNTKTTRKAA